MKRYYLKYGDSYFARDKAGNLFLTTNKGSALFYDENDKNKLINIKNNLPKHYKKDRVILFYSEKDTKSEENNKSSPIMSNNKNGDEKLRIELKSESELKSKSEFDDVKDKICSLSIEFKKMLDSKDTLLKQLSEVDMMISDEMHYIEFYKFSASEGYKICKEIQRLRDERRKIKNKLEAINIINSQTCTGLALGSTLKAFNSIENKQYEPRVLKGLFEGKENRRRKIG